MVTLMMVVDTVVMKGVVQVVVVVSVEMTGIVVLMAMVSWQRWS